MDLNPEDQAALQRAARTGSYHLLLGAGASLEALSPTGRTLPGGDTLKRELAVAFQVVDEENDLLWKIYDRAASSAGPERVYRWLKDRFSNTRPPDWMAYYSKFPWSRVWTLNIDDSFEQAYKTVAKRSSRKLESLNWDSPYRKKSTIDVIHLHGKVDTEEPQKLVFSLNEYIGSAKSDAAWTRVFRDELTTSPFVVVGARLRDEPDLEYILSARRNGLSAPSFYVSPEISPGLLQDLQSWNFIPVQMTAEDFIVEWSDMTGIDLDAEISDAHETGIRFGNQFRKLSEGVIGARDSDLLLGDEPTWRQIKGNVAAQFTWVDEAIRAVAQIEDAAIRSKLVAYTGPRLSGRSTGLLQVGKHLFENSWLTYEFRGEGRLDIESILTYAAEGHPVALLFDGFSDFVDDLDRLLTQANLAKISILCVAVDDRHATAKILGRMSPENLHYQKLFSVPRKLDLVNATRLVETLERQARLGSLEFRSDRQRISHFKEQEIFSSMAELENGRGFGRRVGEMVDQLSNDVDLTLTFIVAYANWVGRTIELSDLALMLQLSSADTESRILHSEHLSNLVQTDGFVVRPRHRWLALARVIQHLGKGTALNYLARGIRAVAHKANRESLRQRNTTPLLIGSMMKFRNLDEVFGREGLDSWYQGLEDLFGSWNARFWEQRAILARERATSDRDGLARSESFAARAVTLTPDAYSFTTLLTVLMTRAEYSDGSEISLYYGRAREAFESAVKLGDGNSGIVTRFAFLRYGLRILESLDRHAKDDPRTEEFYAMLLKDWNDEWRTAEILAQGSADTLKVLRDLRLSLRALRGAGR